MLTKKEPAGIQYLGESGITDSCKQAVIRLIHSGVKIEAVKILTLEGPHSNSHAFLITIQYGTQVVISDGFSSGYSGEGPKGYSYVLNLLSQYTKDIHEYVTPANIFERIRGSYLTTEDLEDINRLSCIRPARWYDFLSYNDENKVEVFHEFPLTIPMALLEPRLISIALEFDGNPDNAILNAYRKIESIVRERTNLVNESSTKLFSKAFQGDDSILTWNNLDTGECKGRASLFTSTFMAYRNNRAHQEPKHKLDDDIREFLLINQLFILEREAVIREVVAVE